MNFIYSDGSGNMYAFEEGILSYTPISQENSSSGYYDGGSPFSISLDVEQHKELHSLVQKAITNKTPNVGKRSMGSGLLKIENNSYIFGMRLLVKLELESFLSQFRKE